MATRIRLLRARELDPGLIAAWRRIQAADPQLASPYFCPEFTQAVGDVRDDVFIAVLETDGVVCGFFPHQRGRLGAGRPVGGQLSDFHGVIAAPELALDAAALLRACRLSEFEFHHLLASQAVFAPGFARVEDSHFLDLSGGYAGYVAQLKEHGSNLIKDLGKKRRRLARECGAPRFTPHETERTALTTLLRWKSEQYHASGLVDIFGFPWTIALLERIHATQTPEFSGMLTTLYVDDRLIAAHMGMRSATVWHWWFPRHDIEFHRYSPGMLLRIYAAECGASFGVRRIDLGQGDETTHKPRLRSGGIAQAHGRCDRPSVAGLLRRLRHNAEAWVRNSPLLPVLRAPGRVFTRLEHRRRYR